MRNFLVHLTSKGITLAPYVDDFLDIVLVAALIISSLCFALLKIRT